MLPDLRDDGGVGVEIAVPALGFVGWVAHQGVAGVPAVVGAGGAGFAVPGPEIGARDRVAGGEAGFGGAVDQAVIALAEGGRDLRVVKLAIAGEAEFFDDQRFAECGG